MSDPIDLWAIRQAIASQLGAALTETTCRPGRDPAATRPCICIEPDDPYVSYYETFGLDGRADIRVLVKVYVATAERDSADIAMDAYLSPNTGRSVFDALNADRTFGGVVETAMIRNPTVDEDDDGLVGTLPIEIVTAKRGV